MEKKPDSLLAFYRRVLRLRQKTLALKLGTVEDIKVNGPVLTFCRQFNHQSLYCVLNFSAMTQTAPDGLTGAQPLIANQELSHLALPPFYAGIYDSALLPHS